MVPAMVNALIFGTGGVGGIYAYILDKGGAAVTVVCRSNYAAVKEHGISIASDIFGNVSVKPSVVKSPADATGSWDYIVVCSKVTVGVSPSTPEILKPAVGPSTAIVLAQNGIGIEDEYAQAFPGNPIISGVVYMPATQTSPGTIAMGPLERLEIGTYPADAPGASKAAAEAFARLFAAAGATCNIFDDVQTKRWSKLMVNASWNPICALTLCNDADFLRSSAGAGPLVKKLMLEVTRVAQARGYHGTNEALAEWQYSRARERLETGGIEPSMLFDVRARKALEVEGIVGNTIRIARSVGVETPLLDLVYALASGLDQSIARGA